jgi:hypothetical protein
MGLAYSWQNFSLTFAVTDHNVNPPDDSAEEYFEFGTLTFAWKHN